MTTKGITCGPESGIITPRDFEVRATMIADRHSAGSQSAKDYCFTVMRQVLLTNGFGDGIKIVDSLTDPTIYDKQVSTAALAVARSYSVGEDFNAVDGVQAPDLNAPETSPERREPKR